MGAAHGDVKRKQARHRSWWIAVRFGRRMWGIYLDGRRINEREPYNLYGVVIGNDLD